ncbi:MAG TPA: dTDP-4-dehydrorhamnose reductase [Polyangiaceae bacterium]|nr:dTDP-4-dehydrorhamnose reductase [Polyangiaceae bacterium]
MSPLAPLQPFLVTGAGGMLGRAWCTLLRQRGLTFRAASREELDVRRPDAIATALDPDVRTLINCAAWTDVDAAESDEASAHTVNAQAVLELALRCRKVAALLVHYSTDHVFGGTSREPYSTDHACAPVNAYGRSKEHGERLLRSADCPHLLIRTSWLYAPWGNNFVRTIARLARERAELGVVADQSGTPTSAEFLAEVTLELLERGVRGTFHVTDGGVCNRYDLARAVAAHVNPSCRIQARATSAYPRPARRPEHAVLDLSQTAALLGEPPGWQVNLKSVLKRL